MRKSPGFTVIVILTLALGIGSVSAIYSLVYSTVIKPLPYPDSHQLYYISEHNLSTSRNGPVASATYLQWQQQATMFDGMSLLDMDGHNIGGVDGLKRAYALISSPNLFELLGVHPVLGHTFQEHDQQGGSPDVALISHNLWQTHFNGSSETIGRTILVNGQSTTIIGVLPADFRFMRGTDLYLPFRLGPASAADFQRRYGCVGRMAAGTESEQALAQLNAIMGQMAQSHPQVYEDFGARLISIHEALTRRNGEQFYFLLAAVSCLLLIACTNIANLVSARSSSRQAEFALRLALGANRSRIVFQLLVESLVLAIIGGGLGVAFGKWCLDAIVAYLPANTNRLHEVALDGHALAVTLLITIGTGIFFGLLPARRASRTDLTTGLKESHRSGTSSKATQRLRSSLVVAQIALALILLAGAGLFFRSIIKAQGNEIGFETDTTYLSVLLLDHQKYPKLEHRASIINRYVEAVERVPGIAAITFTNHTTPMTGGPFYGRFSIAGRPEAEPDQRPRGFYYGVTEDYFKTLQSPLLLGRLFTERDHLGSQPVALINEELARTHFPDENPIGHQITIYKTNGSQAACEIVGVVANIRQYSLTAPQAPQIYQPYAQTPEISTSLMLRTTGGPLPTKAVVAAFQSVDPDTAVTEFYSMERGLSDSLGPFRTSLTIYGVFSVVALMLSTLGIYGVMSYSIAQRTGEFGIRIALGASHGNILRLVLSQGGRLTLLGLGFGLLGATILGRTISTRLYEISPYDPVTLAAITAILALIALLACLLPARRATKVDPMVALRTE
jgi:putative ABC transport system permease protein